MLPRQDPVLRGDWVPNAPLSAEQAAHFDRDGYLVLENIFSTAEVAALQADTTRPLASRSEERRVGKECVSTFRYRRTPSHYKHTDNTIQQTSKKSPKTQT